MMSIGSGRKLTVLTGFAICVVAGWLGVDRLLRKDESAAPTSSVRIGHSQNLSHRESQYASETRSLEELNEILSEAAGEWPKLAGSRYFFEDYADEIVSGFTLEEIQQLGREFVKLTPLEKSRFDRSIFKRWGELAPLDAFSFLDSTSPEIPELAEPFQMPKNDEETQLIGSRYSCVFEGWSRNDPLAAFEGVEKGELSKKISPWHTSSGSIEVFANLCRHDPALARKIAMEKCARGKWSRISSNSCVSSNAALVGYLEGLPEGSNWNKIAETFDRDFPEDSLNNYPSLLTRWIAEDHESALTWFRKTAETMSFEVKWPDDPFTNVSGSEFAIKSHGYEIGQAVGSWFRRDPKNSLEWIRSQNGNLNPECYAGAMFELAYWNSPSAFAEILTVLSELDDLETRGKALLFFNSESFKFEELLAEPEWSREGKIENILREIELPKRYRHAMDYHLLPSK